MIKYQREKGSCKQRLSHDSWKGDSWSSTARPSFGKLKRRKENGISTKGNGREKEYSIYKQRLLVIQKHMANNPIYILQRKFLKGGQCHKRDSNFHLPLYPPLSLVRSTLWNLWCKLGLPGLPKLEFTWTAGGLDQFTSADEGVSLDRPSLISCHGRIFTKPSWPAGCILCWPMAQYANRLRIFSFGYTLCYLRANY